MAGAASRRAAALQIDRDRVQLLLNLSSRNSAISPMVLLNIWLSRFASMAKKVEAFRTTLAGGILFLVPVILILFLLSKGLKVAERLSQPLVNAIGVRTIGGVALGTLMAIAAMVLVSFLAGLAARTRLGQAAYSKLEKSILGILPQWRLARGFVESFGTEKASEVDVVLVPTDAGWCLGFVLEKPPGEWWPVFIPGAPQWTSGSISYAHSDQVHQTGLTTADAILLIRRCGVGSARIQQLLQSLQERDAL